MSRDLRALPKAHLRVHLEGAMRPATLQELEGPASVRGAIHALGADRIQHPLPLLLEAGVRCSINGDDPLLFGPGILEEHELCRDVLGIHDDQLAGIARASLEGSGAPADVVAAGLAGIDEWAAVPG